MAIELGNFFAELLGLRPPFIISFIDRDEDGAVHIHLEVQSNYRPDRFSTIHSCHDKTWRHLDIMEHPCYLHCRLPMWEHKKSRKC